jgi:hypothetical protein
MLRNSVLESVRRRNNVTMPAATAPAGYSAKPLHEKLGYRAGQHVAFIALPPELEGLATSVAFASVTKLKDWRDRLRRGHFDLIHAFTTRQAVLVDGLAALEDAITRDGAIWVSWPKRAAKMATDVTEDRVREAALALDLVDVKVAAVDSVWSGLKLVIRKDRR